MSQFEYFRDKTNWVTSDRVKLGDASFPVTDINDIKLKIRFTPIYYWLKKSLYVAIFLTAMLVLSFPAKSVYFDILDSNGWHQILTYSDAAYAQRLVAIIQRAKSDRLGRGELEPGS